MIPLQPLAYYIAVRRGGRRGPAEEPRQERRGGIATPLTGFVDLLPQQSSAPSSVRILDTRFAGAGQETLSRSG